MRRFFLSLIVCMVLFPLTGQAQLYKVEDVPMVHLEDKTRYVCNPDSILSQSTVAAIDKMLYDLEQSTGTETVVMALTDIDGGDCFQFALDVGEKYGVGKEETDNGLIVLLSTRQGCIQFLTGYGLEGILPDAICKRIQVQYMYPYFKDGNWDQGMFEGMNAVYGYLGGTLQIEMGDEDEQAEAEEELGIVEILMIIALIAGSLMAYALIIWIPYVSVRWLYHKIPKRCPQCHKRAFKRKSSKLVHRKFDQQCHHVVYTCSKCGHTEERDEDSTTIWGIAVGHSSSSDGSGESSDGGSFGGGSFGGGGAGTRF